MAADATLQSSNLLEFRRDASVTAARIEHGWIMLTWPLRKEAGAAVRSVHKRPVAWETARFAPGAIGIANDIAVP